MPPDSNPDPNQDSKIPTPWSGRPGIILFRRYQATHGPVLGGNCRFHPTCSAYAHDAYHSHSTLRATWLTMRRISRCHPFGGRGYDPVPPP